MRKYPEEVRQKVVDLVKKGMSKLDASAKFGMSYRTVVGWTSGIKTQRRYPKHLRDRARSLARRGLPKADVSRITGVPYQTVLNYTRDIKTGKNTGRITGASLKLLRELVANGFAFPSHVSKSSYITLRKYFPVRTVKLHRVRIIYMASGEKKAMEALLKKLNLRSIGYQNLGFIRQAFGIKNIRKNNKIRC
jgi:hypothetical protein